MTLVVMAAGMGSRFGGLKQLTPLTDDDELIIPTTMEMLIADHKCEIRVIPTESVWKGVTYMQDCEPFREFIRLQKANGLYPKTLWENPSFGV